MSKSVNIIFFAVFTININFSRLSFISVTYYIYKAKPTTFQL